MRVFSVDDLNQVVIDDPVASAEISSIAADTPPTKTAITTSGITLSIAGYWRPVTSPTVLSSSYNGTVANTYHGLIRLNSDGQYSMVVTGWGFSGWPPSLTVPAPVSVALFVPDGLGGLKLATSDYISNPVVNGGDSVIVADFNGDGRDDLVLMAHNESPFVATESTSFMSRPGGGFDKIILPGKVMAHAAQVVTVDGVPTIFTATFQPSDDSPSYQFLNGKWVETLDPNPFRVDTVPGDSVVVAKVSNNNEYVMVVGDDWNSANINVYKYDAINKSRSENIIQTITPYLSTLPQYKDFVSLSGPGLTHTYRVWSLDLNKDGRSDILAGESMWSSIRNDWPSALQVLICDNKGLFQDKTTILNPDMKLNTDEMDYDPVFLDIDHSGIETLLFSGSTSWQSLARQADYVLLNDGTGHLYVALHDELLNLAKDVFNFLKIGYSDNSTAPRFIAIPQADGSLNFVAEYNTPLSNPDSSVNLEKVNGFVYVNVPLHYNPTYDYTKDVTISDRNGSMLMRTWAGNDTFYDANSGANAHIDGGAGANISVYSGRQDQYQITHLSDGTVVVTSLSGTSVPVVHDTLKNIQTLKFIDGTVDLLAGGDGADQIIGTIGNDTIHGGGGNDNLFGGSGNDTVYGDAGNDEIHGDDGNDILYGNDGNDFLGGGLGDDTLIGGAGDDGLAGGDGNDSLDGGDGDDTLLGQAGDDTISGGIGRDFIDGGEGNDTINAGDANDLINGGSGNDIINGDAGNDSIYGDAGNDVIDGGAGDDDLSGGDGNDTINGGAGDDRIAGGYGNDILNGGDGNDTISANDGDDTISGGAGIDNLYGFTGNDNIDGGDGNDTLLGMEGDDTVRGGTGADYIVGGDGTDTLYGDDGDDNMQGNDGNDTLNGGLGNDGLDGGAGNDTLNGDAGNDYLGGGEGNDVLNGGDGNDVFVGGAGKDTLTGGAGADAFFFTALTDSTAAAPDKITDFSWADGDYINLSQIDANTTTAGDQAFSFVNSFTKQAGQATLTYDSTSNTSTFSADVDGDGVADFVLQINGQQDTSHGWVL